MRTVRRSKPLLEILEQRLLLSFSSSFPLEDLDHVVWAPPPPLLADFTSDGILDKISSNSHEVLVRPGRGDGTFGDPIHTSIWPTPGAPLLAVADFNGDNQPDVLTAAAIDFESPPTVNVLLGRGDGSFVLAEIFSVGTAPTMIGTGQIFGTGRTDVAIAGYDYLSGEHNVLALFNDGIWWRPTPPPVVGDANGDQKVDAFDLNILASHWQQNMPGGVSVGDFTGLNGGPDGKVDALDLNLIAAHWQEGVTPLPVTAAAPLSLRADVSPDATSTSVAIAASISAATLPANSQASGTLASSLVQNRTTVIFHTLVSVAKPLRALPPIRLLDSITNQQKHGPSQRRTPQKATSASFNDVGALANVNRLLQLLKSSHPHALGTAPSEQNPKSGR